MTSTTKYLFPVILLITCNSLSAQSTNAKKFIEPNISVTYDSNMYRIANWLTNSYYETEAYDFKYLRDTGSKVNIHIQAGHPRGGSKARIDSLLRAKLASMKSASTDSLKVVGIDTTVQNIHGFSCIGFVLFEKSSNMYVTIINGYHFTDNDRTEVQYQSLYRNHLAKEYEILNNFLKGFETYSIKQLDDEELKIKNKYTIAVSATSKTIEKFKFRNKTYVGVVSIKEPLENIVKEVILPGKVGSEIFSSDDGKTVYILCSDRENGLVTRMGQLVIIDSFGKKVKIPFSFSYENKGNL